MRPLRLDAGRWAMPGIVFTAIVMAATPGEDGTAEMALVQGDAGPSVPAQAALQPEAVHVELERLTRPQPEPEKIANVFGATSWYVPPPPPPPPPPGPLPAPTAPPVPFTYLGLYEDAPMRVVILIKGEQMYTVSEGEVIEDTYRIEHFVPGRVELTYLPLNTKQTLGSGETL